MKPVTYLKNEGISRKDFAERLGISYTGICTKLRKNKDLTERELEKMSKFTQVFKAKEKTPTEQPKEMKDLLSAEKLPLNKEENGANERYLIFVNNLIMTMLMADTLADFDHAIELKNILLKSIKTRIEG